MKKKTICCLISFFAILLIGFFCVYHVRTTNEYFTGSNTEFYRDIFDYPNSEWVCEEPKIELNVIDLRITPHPEFDGIVTPLFAIMETEVAGEKKEFIMMGERGGIEIYESIRTYKDGEYINTSAIFHGFARYKKKFSSGEVTSFTISNIKEDKIFNHKYEKLKFKRKGDTRDK